MPNPLTAILSAPASTGKTQAKPQETPEAKAENSFQSVLDQEAGQHADLLRMLEPQEPESEADTDGTEVEAEVAPEATPVPFTPEITEDIAKTMAPSQPAAPLISPSQTVDRTAIDPATAQVAETTRRSAEPITQTPVFTVPKNTTGSRDIPLQQEPQTDISKAAQPEIVLKEGRKAETPVETRSGQTPRAEPPKHAPTVVQMQLSATQKPREKQDFAGLAEPEDIAAPRESAPVSSARDTATALQYMTASARADTARAIAGQMAAVINARPQAGTIEVALNPEELGRVSIVLNGREDGFQISIAAERPETLEIMRRHIAVLEAEFKNLGLGDLSFNLGTSSDAQHDSDNRDTAAHFDPEATENPLSTPSAPTRIRADGRIDIRL